MQLSLAVVIIAVLSVAVFAQVPASTAYANIDFSEAIAAHAADTNFTGSILVVGDRTGNLLAQVEGNITMTSSFLIASATKWLTSAITIQFVRRGLLDWDDKPQKFLPWWTTDPTDGRSNITVKDLLSFTSGFVGEMGAHPTNTTITDCITGGTMPFEDCVRIIHDYCFVYNKSGTVFDYGSTHMSVLAAMMMRISNLTTYNAIGQEYLNKVLGIPQTMRYGRNPSGGANFNTLNYEIVLREFFLKNPAVYDVITEQDYTPDGKVTIVNTPLRVSTLDWHYALGHWIECNSTKFTQADLDRQIFSSPGAFGYYPWVDRVNDYYAILARYGPGISNPATKSVLLGQTVQPLIVKALKAARSSSPASAPSASTTSSPPPPSAQSVEPPPPIQPSPTSTISNSPSTPTTTSTGQNPSPSDTTGTSTSTGSTSPSISSSRISSTTSQPSPSISGPNAPIQPGSGLALQPTAFLVALALLPYFA